MRILLTTWKIGVAVLIISVLAWLPWDMKHAPACWGPVPCLGQEAGETVPTPETIILGSFSGNSFTGYSIIIGNTLTQTSGVYHTEISNSFQGFTGIMQVNQAAGSLNNQLNVTGTAFSQGELSQISLSYKSQIKDNSLTTSGNDYQASITGTSFAGGSGIALVNQAAGNMNAQLNAFSLNLGTAGANGAISLTDAELTAAKTNNSITYDPDPAKANKYSTALTSEAPAQNFTGLWSSNQIAGNIDQVTTVFNVNVTTVP